MKINEIRLNNFGSYKGETIFNTMSSNERHVIVIGGKNGAGKTTLFTAIRLCLYGYMSMGYNNQNSVYMRKITKLINNEAKLTRPAIASVSMKIALNNGRGLNYFNLSREWTLADSLSESFHVEKDGTALNKDEIADFEKYLLSIIPPDLFNLYFFDGEKIADFFLEEGGNTRIKNAFLTLCGYDTFDIMRKNFKRIATSDSENTTAIDLYLAAKTSLESMEKELLELLNSFDDCSDKLVECNAELELLDRSFHQKGGITEEEWSNKIYALKEEEKRRETINALLKRWANDMIPFLMIRDNISELRKQISKENDVIKYRNFCEILDCEKISDIIGNQKERLQSLAFDMFGGETKLILDLSMEQSSSLMAQINQILEFDTDKIAKAKRRIKRSLSSTAKIRAELDNSSISNANEYIKQRADLFEKKSLLLVQRSEIEQLIANKKIEIAQAESEFKKIKAQVEHELKKASINGISARAILMLDNLQEKLYHRQITKVEEFFRTEINTLMRKTKFIDDIKIDDNFNVHIYRTETLKASKLLATLSTNTKEQLVRLLGQEAISKLWKKTKSRTTDDVVKYFISSGRKTITLPIEIDKSSLSNGEKQIFIMALYHSLISLCDNKIPFIIDTPFARIDTEHRINISKHFFSELEGQVFILSTNEEINSTHMQILKEKISCTYMLENTDNKQTIVKSNSYFEV